MKMKPIAAAIKPLWDGYLAAPFLTLFQNPLEQGLQFISRERQQTTLMWHARIPA